MATLESIAGKNGCGSEDASTGKLGCQIEFGTPMHLFKLKKGLVIPKTTVLDKDYLNSLIQSNKLTPLVDASSFEDLSGEDSVSSNSRTVERLNILGLPKYKLMFEEGHEFYRQMAKLTSFKSADFAIGDEYGNLKLAINSNGDFVGFSAGQVLPELTKNKVQGGDAESKSLTVQFLNRKQFDEDYTIVTSEQLGFDLIEVQGANPVSLSFNSVPTDGDTTLLVVAKLSADKSTNVEGLVIADFLVKVDGATATVSNVAESNGVYTLTIPSVATGNVVTVDLYDGTINSGTILNGGVLYNSGVALRVLI